jgi:hypothetical protein
LASPATVGGRGPRSSSVPLHRRSALGRQGMKGGAASDYEERGFKQRMLCALDASEFLPQLAPNGLGNVEQDSAEFCEREQTKPLPIVHRYHARGVAKCVPQCRNSVGADTRRGGPAPKCRPTEPSAPDWPLARGPGIHPPESLITATNAKP